MLIGVYALNQEQTVKAVRLCELPVVASGSCTFITFDKKLATSIEKRKNSDG